MILHNIHLDGNGSIRMTNPGTEVRNDSEGALGKPPPLRPSLGPWPAPRSRPGPSAGPPRPAPRGRLWTVFFCVTLSCETFENIFKDELILLCMYTIKFINTHYQGKTCFKSLIENSLFI